MSLSDIKNKIATKIRNNSFFRKQFGFESGIDITNDNQVLYRKNVVIKNIIFISNIIYTLIFAIISLGDPSNSSNWLLTILLFPVTFFVNSTLKKLINKGADDKMSQTIAMYFASFYMFLSTLVIYFKLKYGYEATGANYLQECGYILIYYSLLICAFYQDKKMLKNIFLWVFILVTILHFTVTYSIVSRAQQEDLWTFLKDFITGTEVRDILIRTILLVMFMLVLYVYVSMANYMQDERIKELVKRRRVQEDFTNVVTKIFDVTLSNKTISDEERHSTELLSIMSKKLASLLSIKPEEVDKIVEFSTIHIDRSVDFITTDEMTEDEKFESLRQQTELGSALISRIQLARKCENIVRAALEGSDTEEFINNQREIQSNIESQIILICELYITMRSVKSYKRAYNHSKAIAFMEGQCKIYFDPMVFDRFIRFGNDFEAIYDEM